jgi:glyceraldehyde-3-phosphate dehydrogenase type I
MIYFEKRRFMITIALNGFGRIGRTFIRTIMLNKKALKHIKIAVINIGPAKIDTVAHMFTYDTIMGKFPGTVTMRKHKLIINGVAIDIIAELDPQKINWKHYRVDWVVDATGKFINRHGAQKHIDAGASHVLITAPAKDEDVAIIPGVNESAFNPKKDRIVSLGSCTTNAFITMLKVINDNFGINQGFMTTMHAYTNSQVLLDVEGEDLRRSRAAALNIIPTTTGASSMVGKIIPELAHKIHALAIRVPVGIVSLIDLSFTCKKKLSATTINKVFMHAAEKKLSGIIGFTAEPLVSSDFIGSPFSVVIDGALTDTVGTMGKVFGWYDNEWGYSMRLVDFLLYVNAL